MTSGSDDTFPPPPPPPPPEVDSSGSPSGSPPPGCDCTDYNDGGFYSGMGGKLWRQPAALTFPVTGGPGGTDSWYLFPRTTSTFEATGTVTFDTCNVQSISIKILADIDHTTSSGPTVVVFVDGANKFSYTFPAGGRRDPEGSQGQENQFNTELATITLNGACIANVQISGTAGNTANDEDPGNTMLRVDITNVTKLPDPEPDL